MTDINRRNFLKGMGATAIPGMINFGAMAEAAAQSSNGSEYKALVCINLRGGNDHANTLIPYVNDSLDYYKEIRGEIALTHNYSVNQLNATKLPKTKDERPLHYSLHPELTFFKKAFDEGKLAILQNCGVLKEANTTRSLARTDRLKYLPPNLFSHNDQQAVWQTGALESEQKFGWGGYLAEQNSASNVNRLFTSIGTKKKSQMFTSESLEQFVINLHGTVRFLGTSEEEIFLNYKNHVSEYVEKMMKEQRDNIFENYISKTFENAFEAHKELSLPLSHEINDTSSVVNLTFTDSDGLAKHLKMIAHLIKIHKTLGVKRQLFMVNQSGHDVHSGVLVRHNALMKDLNLNLERFYHTLEAMNMTEQVTTFTISEMGRSFANNGNGSDHGWGGHQFILGGAVKGGEIYGKTPDYVLGSEDDFSQGRLIPSTAREQYIATLALWFGVDAESMQKIAPNLSKFGSANLGFFR